MSRRRGNGQKLCHSRDCHFGSVHLGVSFFWSHLMIMLGVWEWIMVRFASKANKTFSHQFSVLWILSSMI
jgi:hypothetical protein